MGVQLPLPAPPKTPLIHFLLVTYGGPECGAE